MPLDSDYLTIAEVCQILQISDQTLLRMRKKGLIAVIYPNGGPGPGTLVRIHRSEVEKFKEMSQ